MFDIAKSSSEKGVSGQLSRPLLELASDQAYAMLRAFTLRSIVESNKASWPLDFHMLTNGISKDTQKEIVDSLPKGSASIRWVPVNLELFRKISLMLSQVSRMTYARLLIPHVLSNTVSRVSSVDTDVLVLDDLTPLWETDRT